MAGGFTTVPIGQLQAPARAVDGTKKRGRSVSAAAANGDDDSRQVRKKQRASTSDEVPESRNGQRAAKAGNGRGAVIEEEDEDGEDARQEEEPEVSDLKLQSRVSGSTAGQIRNTKSATSKGKANGRQKKNNGASAMAREEDSAEEQDPDGSHSRPSKQQEPDASDSASPRSTSSRQSGHEIAKLQATLRQERAAYAKVSKLFDELSSLRNTEAETKMQEMKKASDERAAHLRDQVQTYSKESQDLKSENAELKAELAALRSQGQAADGDGDETVHGEQAGNATTFVAETQYQRDTTLHKSSSSASLEAEASASTISELREQLAALQDSEASLRIQLKETRAANKQLKKDMEDASRAGAAEVERERRKYEALAGDLAKEKETAAKELQFEQEQSKKLLQQYQMAASQGQQLGASVGSGSASHTPSQATTAANGSKAYEESQALIQVMDDLTGLHCVSQAGNSFSFILTDAKKKRCLSFRLVCNSNERKVDYHPDLKAGRDDAIMQLLSKDFQVHIQFDWDALPLFWRRLWKGLNDGK